MQHSAQCDRWAWCVDFISMKYQVSPELGGPPNKARCAGMLLLGCWILCLRSLCEIEHPYRDHLCARSQGVFLFSLRRFVCFFCLLMNPLPPMLTTSDLSLILVLICPGDERFGMSATMPAVCRRHPGAWWWPWLTSVGIML